MVSFLTTNVAGTLALGYSALLTRNDIILDFIWPHKNEPYMVGLALR